MAFLVAQDTLSLLPVGPFVSALDGVTALAALTVLASDLQLSTNGGAFTASSGVSPALPLGEGYYRVTLAAADVATLGLVRLSVQVAPALPVWVDLFVVPAHVFALLGGAAAAPVVLEDTALVVTLGPFIAETDGVTVQSALPLTSSEVRISKNEAPLVASTALVAPAPLGFGHYAVTLSAADVATPGRVRVTIDRPGSLVVWTDLTVGTATTWAFYTTVPPAPPLPSPVPPAPAAPSVLGGRAASTLYSGLSAVLDDPQQLRAEEAVLLRVLSQSQQWVALRYRLLIHSFDFSVVQSVPWYPLPVTHPRLLMVTEVLDASGSMLTPVPLTRLRYSDPQWLASTGTPTRFYRVGWTQVGLWKVPDLSASYTLTGVCLPRRLLEGGQLLETPRSYDDAVLMVASGLLLIARERQYQKGLLLIAQGLGVTTPQTTEVAA